MSLAILVVEDNLDNIKLISWVLEDGEHRVSVATSGEQALEVANTQKFDLILMDIGLPGICGEETTKQIRNSNGYNAAIPIVAVTAHALTSEVDRFMKSGFSSVLTKPIDEAEALRLIADLERE